MLRSGVLAMTNKELSWPLCHLEISIWETNCRSLGVLCGVTQAHLSKQEPRGLADVLPGNRRSWKNPVRVLEQIYCISAPAVKARGDQQIRAGGDQAEPSTAPQAHEYAEAGQEDGRPELSSLMK